MTSEEIMLKFVKSDIAPALAVRDSYIIRYAYGEPGEFTEGMGRAFHGHFKKDTPVKQEIGVMLASHFDGKDCDGLTFAEPGLRNVRVQQLGNQEYLNV